MSASTEYRIPIAGRRPVTVTIEELDGRVVPLRPLSGRVLKLYEEAQKHPNEPTRILDIVEAVLGGEGRLTRDEIDQLSMEALEQIMVIVKTPVAELEAAAKKDAGSAA